MSDKEPTEGAALITTISVHPNAEGYVERITPKNSPETLFFFTCKCGGIHHRHAGYVSVLLPFFRPPDEKRVNKDDRQVMVCVKCKKSYIWNNEQMYDVTDRIDLQAWEKTEKEAYKATGPGGQC